MRPRALAGVLAAFVVLVLVAVLAVVLTRGGGDEPGASPGSTGTSSSGTGDGDAGTALPEDPDDPAYDVALSTPKEDSTYGQYGDPGVDTLHYDLDLAYDRATKTLTGTADIALRAARTAPRLQLDLRSDYDIASVTLDGAPVSYTQTPTNQLVVTAPVTLDQRYDLVISYSGRPLRAWAPSQRQDLPFVGLQRSATTRELWTMQEPYGAWTWYPVNDQPSDKALYDFTLRAPEGWVGIANGVLTSQDTEDGQTVTTWHLDEPAASYLVTMAMGDYVETTDESASGVQISYWTRRGDTATLDKLRATPDIMAWNEEHLGPYPFDSLGLVVVDSESAMETQTMITLGDSSYPLSADVIQHEMAHQWYGDMMTPTDWQDLWMNEGMAMFVQFAYMADRSGVSLDRTIGQVRGDERFFRSQYGPPGDFRKNYFGESNVYYGGALMWNGIRQRMGDQAFWAMVRKWPTVRPYGNATRAQYVAWLEQETGLRLAPYIHAWLMDRRTPTKLQIP